MKLKPRLTLFTISLVAAVVAFTSVSTIISLGYLLKREMNANHKTLFSNFLEASEDALYLGDDLAVQSYSESLEKSVPGLAYALFQDTSRGGIVLGGLESLERFKKFRPTCTSESNEVLKGGTIVGNNFIDGYGWRFYCKELDVQTLRGGQIKGTVFLGFNNDLLELELEQIIGRMWRTLMWGMIVVFVMGLMGAFILSGRLTKPILTLTEGAKSIGEGKLDTQIPIESTDELGFLAQEFNLMAEKLQELDRLKDDFVSSVSHELRSPLAAISGYVELLRSKPIDEIAPEKREKALKIMQISSDRLAEFINNILDLAKIESGMVEIRLADFDVRLVVDDLVNLYQPLLEKKSIQTVVDIHNNVPIIEADADKIRQVLTNLISNALKFTPEGGKITIMARNQNDLIQISVIDTGVGIPEKDKDRIFEKFRQVKETERSSGQKGTGLGLAIAKGIIDAHGGHIWIESEVGQGTTVHFTLPKHPIEK